MTSYGMEAGHRLAMPRLLTTLMELQVKEKSIALARNSTWAILNRVVACGKKMAVMVLWKKLCGEYTGKAEKLLT
jgi:hypothetical protein